MEAFPGVWDKYILSPLSRTVRPKAIYGVEGDVSSAAYALDDSAKSARLSGANATLVIDFEGITAGRATITFGPNTSINQKVGLGFSESEFYIGRDSDYSRSFIGPDGHITVEAAPGSSYTMTKAELRGGFRYLTIFNIDGGVSEINSVSLYYTPAPNTLKEDELRKYTGYFYSDDDLLNKIWYAGVNTIQMSTIGAGEGRLQFPPYPREATGWFNDAEINPIPPTEDVQVDGARRDRAYWAGDCAISLPSAFVSHNYNNLRAVRNGIDSIWYRQNPETGICPYAGPPIRIREDSDTYHVWCLIASYDYYFHTGDLEWIKSRWEQYKLGLAFALKKIDSTGLFNVTLTDDWGRSNVSGHMTEANILLWKCLLQSIFLASPAAVCDASADVKKWKSLADGIAKGLESTHWDEEHGMYRDNDAGPTKDVYPQDGNSIALTMGLTTDAARMKRISEGLEKGWSDVGSVAPEAAGTVSMFFGGLETRAHFIAGQHETALELIRRQWGFAIKNFSHNTFIEGFYKTGALHYPFYAGTDSFINFCHPWSTGPTHTLIYCIVGLEPTSVDSATWSFSPCVNTPSMRQAQGGFATTGGKYSAGWSRKSDNFINAWVETPTGTVGKVIFELPDLSEGVVRLDGTVLWQDGKVKGDASIQGNKLVLDGVKGGSVLLEWSSGKADFTPKAHLSTGSYENAGTHPWSSYGFTFSNQAGGLVKMEDA